MKIVIRSKLHLIKISTEFTLQTGNDVKRNRVRNLLKGTLKSNGDNLLPV